MPGATAIAAIMLVISFAMLLVINLHPGLEPPEVRHMASDPHGSRARAATAPTSRTPAGRVRC